MGATNLERGTPINDHIDVQGTINNYYLDPVSFDSQDTHLYFAVTPYSGDPDIYIGCQTCPTLDENGNMQDFKWSSKSSNDDIVVIPQESLCSEQRYCVSIYGHTATKFGLVSYVTDDEITLNGDITNAFSLIAATTSSTYARFKYSPPPSANFTVAVTPIVGDPDLYIKEGENAKPSKDVYDWKSKDFGFDVVEILPSDEHYKDNGIYHIAVYAFGSESIFSISVSTHDTPVLVGDGVPVAGVVEEDEYDYYTFSLLTDREHSLFIDLTTLGIASQGGDPDLYIALGRKPTKTDSDWESRGFGYDFVQISKSEAAKGQYYIGVHGFRKATYQLVVYTEGNNVVLTAGVPASAEVSRGEYSYFKFRHQDDEAGLLFRTFANRGKATTYVSEKITKPTKDEGKHDYASTALTDQDSLIYIRPEDNTEQWYWAGVYGEQSYNNFTITASTNQTVTLLEESETSYFNRVPQKAYRYFTFITDDLKKDLTILVSPIVGDADLYVSNTIERPSTSHYTWKSTSSGTDAVTISKDDPNWNNSGDTGRLYIAVYGWTESIFNIRVFLSEETQLLSESMVTPGTVDQDRYAYFKFEVAKGSKVAFYIDLKVRSENMDADLYVSTTSPKPTKEDHQWKSTNFGDDYLRVDDASAPDGIVYIGVLGVSADGASFTILYATEMLQLTSTEPLLDSVLSGKYRNYRIHVDRHVEAVSISVTLVDGVTELYLNTNNTGSPRLPTRRDNDLNDVHFPGNSLVVRKGEKNFITGEWVFSVYGTHESTYFISFMENVGALTQGTPRLGTASHAYNPLYYFFIDLNRDDDTVDDHYIYVDVLNSEVEVYASQEHHVPNEEHHDWQSKGPGDHFITLEKSKLEGGKMLYISVKASPRIIGGGNLRFVISVNKAGSPLFLTSDVPQEKVTRPGEMSYFRVLTPAFQQVDPMHKPNKTLEVTVESCTPFAAPNFYLSQNETKPSNNVNDKASTEGESHFVQFAAMGNVMAKSAYHIGVDGGKNGSTYAIFATAGVNQRPVPGNKGKLSGHYDKKKQTLTLELHDASSTTFPHYYTGYAVPYTTEEGDGSDLNFDTFCAVEVFGTDYGRFIVEGPHSKEADTKFKMQLNDLNEDEIYAINILVEGGFSGSSTTTGPGGEGLKAVYKKVWLVHGELKDNPIYHKSGYRFRVGWFLIGMSLGAFALYFVIGVIYKAVRGARGIDLIPNVDFWKDLPLMIRDGIVFTFTCGRGSLSGASRYEDLDRSASTNADQPAGYGSI